MSHVLSSLVTGGVQRVLCDFPGRGPWAQLPPDAAPRAISLCWFCCVIFHCNNSQLWVQLEKRKKERKAGREGGRKERKLADIHTIYTLSISFLITRKKAKNGALANSWHGVKHSYAKNSNLSTIFQSGSCYDLHLAHEGRREREVPELAPGHSIC